MIDARGIAATAAQVASPNQDDRPTGAAISLIVVHGISLPPGRFGGDGVARLFTNTLDAGADPYYRGIAHLRVSSHFFIRRDGALVQFVACGRRAVQGDGITSRGARHARWVLRLTSLHHKTAIARGIRANGPE